MVKSTPHSESVAPTSPRRSSPSAEFRCPGPVAVFPQNSTAAWFWFVMALLTLVFLAAQPYLLISSYKKNERVVIMDEQRVFHVAPVLGLEEAKQLYEYISMQAALAFLNRNPNGFDNQVLLEQLYLPEAKQQAWMHFRKDFRRLDMKRNNVHLKGEVARVRILETAPGKILSQALGQMICTGKRQGRDYVQVFDFKIDFKLVRNPYLSRNGRLPYVVEYMFYKTRKAPGA